MKTVNELREENGRNEIPEGRNGLDSKNSFLERKFYKESLYPESLSSKGINFWYEKPLYGLIDRKARVVYPSESALKQLKSKKTIFAINFVADAFEDFSKFMNAAVAAGRIEKKGSVFSKIEAKNGWESVHKNFHSLMEIHYDQFYTVWSTKKNRKCIPQSFQDFSEYFLEYLKPVVHEYPATRSYFVRSSLCSPMISGLIIEIAEEDHSNDERKVLKYLNDPNFEFYRNTARKFGFMVDENAPWRLVAELGSTAMKNYMKKYEITFDNMFDKLYYRATHTDFSVTKAYFKYFFESYFNLLSDSDLSRVLPSRVKVSNSDDFNFIIIYFRIKLYENKFNLTKLELNNSIKEFKLVYFKLGLIKTIDLIEDKLKLLNRKLFKKERLKYFN